MRKIKITTYSHFYRVTIDCTDTMEIFRRFTSRFLQWGFVKQNRQMVRRPIKVFAAAPKNRAWVHYHINTLPEFLQFLKENHYTDEFIEITKIPVNMKKIKKAKFKILPHMKPRDEQPDAIEYLVDPNSPTSLFLGLQTGKGKSFCALYALSKFGYRFGMVIKPMYIDKWLVDFQKATDLNLKEDVVVVRGSKQLIELQQMVKAKTIDFKAVIFSNMTLLHWLKLYEEIQDEIFELGYCCRPHELCEFLGFGPRVTDESHQDFHFNFKLSLYTHVWKTLDMSATLVNEDNFINRMYETLLPGKERFNTRVYDAYILGKALIYNLDEPRQVQTTQWGQKTYSHTAFEASILRKPKLKANYFHLIKWSIDVSYLAAYVPGNKCMVFCSSVEMCTELTEYLSKQFPQFDVRRYVGTMGDPRENLIDSDIRVSTLQSGGTAQDVPNLQTTILTTSINSQQANEQGLGRTRKMKDGQKPIFLWFVCEDIPKHVEYHRKKREILDGKLANYATLRFGGKI